MSVASLWVRSFNYFLVATNVGKWVEEKSTQWFCLQQNQGFLDCRKKQERMAFHRGASLLAR